MVELVKFDDTKDFNLLKFFVSNHVFEVNGRSYPPMLIKTVCVDGSFKDALTDFEKEYETTLEKVDDFDSKYFSGVISEWEDFDCCSVFGKNLVIFVKKLG